VEIYILKNFTLQEVYFGSADGNLQEVVRKHRTDPVSPVSHWKFGVEEIKWGVVQDGLPAGVTASFLQALRREPPDEGWVIVFGGDDLKQPEEEEEETFG